jgi:amino acid transporter
MTNRAPVDPSAILFKGVGTWDAIAIAVAGMAPTMAMNLNPQEPADHVGRVVPLVFALSTVVVLLVAWSFARLARDHPNAGSAYGFVAAILGPRAGLIAGWTLMGTYLAFAVVGLSAAGLFSANLLQRLDLWRDASSFGLTLAAAVVIGPLCVIPTRRAGLVLLILEGVAVAAMLLMACAVLLLVAQGHGPQADPPLRDLFIPAAGVGAASIALGLSFGLLSFAGFEQAATLGEEVKRSSFTIPRVLVGTVLAAGFVFTLVTAAQTLGFGTDPAGVARFSKSTSLLADLSARYFGGWSADLFDALAVCSALGGALASIVACSRILFALCRDIVPASPMAQVSQASGTPRNAAVGVMLAAIVGYAAMRPAGRLSARGRQRGRRSHSCAGAGPAMVAVHTGCCRGGDRLHLVGQRLSAATRRLSRDPVARPRLVLPAPRSDARASEARRSHFIWYSGREGAHSAGPGLSF